MNRYKLTKAGVDCNEGIRRFGGDRDGYEEMLRMMLDEPTYANMIQALEDGDAKAAFDAAHSLKGVSGNLSLIKLHANILPLVEELRAGKLDRVEELLPPVRSAYYEAIDAIRIATHAPSASVD